MSFRFSSQVYNKRLNEIKNESNIKFYLAIKTMSMFYGTVWKCISNVVFYFITPSCVLKSVLTESSKISWDSRNIRDGRGDQAPYAESVKLCQYFHQFLPGSNSNKMPDGLQGTMLKSQLYGRASDLAKVIPDHPLAVVKELYGDFNSILSVKRGDKASFRSYELRLQAQVPRFYFHFESSAFLESLYAFLLLGNANVDSGQRVSILAACAPNSVEFKKSNTTEKTMKLATYKLVAAIIRQCEKKKEHVLPVNSSFARRRTLNQLS